ncbi:SagB family peptide dehydrogenase [Kitasatospora sp. NPDC059673]|uniref:SagB family peptide dehydrogenase n=1 Tax=Kitasatospora sp. NPDC059673 TaxID=3346901 RepID=UPI00367D1092
MRIECLAAPQLTELWSLREDTLIDPDDGPDGTLTVLTRWGPVYFANPDPVLRSALERMTLGPVSLNNVAPGFPGLEDLDRPEDHSPEVTKLLRGLRRIRHCLVRTLALGNTPLLSIVPLARNTVFEPQPAPGDRPCRLSRFAVLRYAEGGLRLESPLAHHRVQLHRPEMVQLLALLAGGDRPVGLQLDPEVAAAAIGYLLAARIVVAAEHPVTGTEEPVYAEDDDPTLAGWSADDMMMHARSRLGRSDGPFGATFAHLGRMPAEPTAKPLGARAAIPLPRPDLEQLRTTDEPFSSVLERRRSVRQYGPDQLSVRQIGELLFRSCRIREGADRDGRPYPSMGSVYALELYLVAGPDTELPPGVYHYDPLGHLLEPLDAPAAETAELRAAAQATLGADLPPPLLLVLTARFRRTTHAFSGIGYTSLMKDVGVLMQSLYLVSTAMGLAPCALASGNSDTAARAFGLDWAVESSVGEFVVGPSPSAADQG